MKHTVESVLKKCAPLNGESGTCWDAASNLERLNDVRELIYDEGDYEGTMEWGCVRIDDCKCIYLPAHLETVRDAWISSMPLLVRDRHYMDLETVRRTLCCSCSPDSRRALQNTDIRRPVQRLPDFTFALRMDFEDDEDEGVEVRVVAKDDAGGFRTLSFTASDEQEGTWKGEHLKDVVSVTKPVTSGRVFLRAVPMSSASADSDEGVENIAEYQPWQENPTFTQMRVVNYVRGDCDVNLVVYAKKAFRRLSSHSELVDIMSVSALKFGYQAIRAQEADRDEDYASKINLMRRALNMADKNLGISEGSVEITPSYSRALNPRYDNAQRI